MDFIAYNDASNPAVDRWAALINSSAAAAGVPPCALAAIVERESGGNPNARSGDGGWGLAQVTYGVDANGIYTATGQKMLDPASNLQVAATSFLAPALKECLLLRERYGTAMNAINSEVLYFAFIAYNAGFGAVSKAAASGSDPDNASTNHYGAGTLAIYHRDVDRSHAHSP